MRVLTLLGVAAAVLSMGGCKVLEGGTAANRIGDADGALGPWYLATHPCVGNRTDAMWFDDAMNGYVGCGSTTDGYGLFETHDGGVSWAATSSSPSVFADMRVSSIQRADDGVLYVAGTGQGGVRVVSLDGGTAEGFSMHNTWHVGTFRMADDGRAVSESLTGSDVHYWPTASTTEPVDGYGWWNQTDIEGSGAQILDLETYDGRFYGVGSTISQPPYFYYEADEGMGQEFGLEAVKLSGDGLGDFIGEVWSLDVDESGNMVAAGVNETSNVGMVYWSDGDPTSWSSYDITPIVPEFDNNRTTLYGACRDGDTMVAVGMYSQEETALLVLSMDGGSTWNLYTPPGYSADAVGPLSQCQIFGTDVYITGADGFFGVLYTADL